MPVAGDRRRCRSHLPRFGHGDLAPDHDRSHPARSWRCKLTCVAGQPCRGRARYCSGNEVAGPAVVGVLRPRLGSGGADAEQVGDDEQAADVPGGGALREAVQQLVSERLGRRKGRGAAIPARGKSSPRWSRRRPSPANGPGRHRGRSGQITDPLAGVIASAAGGAQIAAVGSAARKRRRHGSSRLRNPITGATVTHRRQS